MELMLRICFVRHWFTLSEPAIKEEIYESTSVRRFLKLDSLTDSVPDESTMLRFRHLLQAHALAGKLFESVNADLVDKGLLLRGGSMLEATRIAAPGSTKNQEPKQDPEMSLTKKGNDCSNSRYHHFTRLKKRFSLANYFQGETIRIK